MSDQVMCPLCEGRGELNAVCQAHGETWTMQTPCPLCRGTCGVAVQVDRLWCCFRPPGMVKKLSIPQAVSQIRMMLGRLHGST